MIVKEVALRGSVESFDLINVVFEDSTEALMVGFYSQVVPFIGEDVDVAFHDTFYDGGMKRFIFSITGVTKITTVESGTKIKLFSDFVDNNATINFADIENGEIVTGTVLCTKQEFKSSNKSTWHELSIRDRSGKYAILRIFNVNKLEANFAGRYISGDFRKNLPFSFDTYRIDSANGIEAIDPDVEIAESYVKSFLENNDVELLQYIQSSSLLKFMKEYVDMGRGFTLVKAAIQLELLQAMENVITNVDKDLLISAIFLQYGYVASASKKGYSRSVRNFHFMNLIKYPNDKKERMMLLLNGSEDLEDISMEKKVFDEIRSTAESLYNMKKGVM